VRSEFDVVMALAGQGTKRVLDVGCGVGRYLVKLSEVGHTVSGLDVNPETCRQLREKNYDVGLVGDHVAKKEYYDLVLISHVIEHVAPNELIAFLDGYLDELKPRGQLILASPCLTRRFYGDYDHIKPYNPDAIQTLYSPHQQHQCKPRYRLELGYVWRRREPLRVNSYTCDTARRRIVTASINAFLELAFRFSGGILGEQTGWVGSFVKQG